MNVELQILRPVFDLVESLAAGALDFPYDRCLRPPAKGRRIDPADSAGGGAVKVTVTGLGEILDVVIDPNVIASGDVELIQDLVCAGVREALHKASDLKREKVTAATPLAGMGLDLPDIF